MDRGAWRATVYGVAKSWTRLNDQHTQTHTHTYTLRFVSVMTFTQIGHNYEAENGILLSSFLIQNLKSDKSNKTQPKQTKIKIGSFRLLFSHVRLCDTVDCSPPGFPDLLGYLPEIAP